MKKWEVTFRLPDTGTKYHKHVIEAETQIYAKRLFQNSMPHAIICGNPRPL